MPESKEPTKLYRLKSDFRGRHIHDGNDVQPGQTVALSPRQYEAFKDRFEPAGGGQAGMRANVPPGGNRQQPVKADPDHPDGESDAERAERLKNEKQ